MSHLAGRVGVERGPSSVDGRKLTPWGACASRRTRHVTRARVCLCRHDIGDHAGYAGQYEARCIAAAPCTCDGYATDYAPSALTLGL